MSIITKQPQPQPIRKVCFPQIFLRKQNLSHLESQDKISLALLKYFPKYIDSLPYNSSIPKIRIKRLKIIEKIPTDLPNNVLRILFQNKRRNVKFASGVEDREAKGGYSKRNLDLLKMFPSIQKVEFCFEVQYFTSLYHQNAHEKQYYWIDRMSNYLNKMKNLKHLKFSDRSCYLLPLLSKLNSFETILNGLEVFRLNFVLSYPEDFPDFQKLLNYKIVLKNLSHLELNLPEYDDFFEVFQLFPDHCPRLLSLSYVINQQNSFSDLENPSYLECLQGFQNLQKLSLSCCKRLDVFKRCKFPKSLRYLNLSLDDIEWKNLITKETFYSKQEGLQNLEKLKISLHLYDPTKEKHFIRAFIEDLLSRISNLREYSMDFFPHLQIREGCPSYPFDLSRFFSCFQHLGHSIKKLEIDDSHSRYVFDNFENTQAFNFPELSFLSIKGRSISSLSVLENITKLIQVKPNDSKVNVKLERIKIDSCKSLIEFFNILKRTSGKKIQLVVEYYSTVEDDEYFKDNYEQVKKDSRNLRNVSLEIKFSIKWPRFRWMKELKSLGECFGNFVVIERVHF